MSSNKVRFGTSTSRFSQQMMETLQVIYEDTSQQNKCSLGRQDQEIYAKKIRPLLLGSSANLQGYFHKNGALESQTLNKTQYHIAGPEVMSKNTHRTMRKRSYSQNQIKLKTRQQKTKIDNSKKYGQKIGFHNEQKYGEKKPLIDPKKKQTQTQQRKGKKPYKEEKFTDILIDIMVEKKPKQYVECKSPAPKQSLREMKKSTKKAKQSCSQCNLI